MVVTSVSVLKTSVQADLSAESDVNLASRKIKMAVTFADANGDHHHRRRPHVVTDQCVPWPVLKDSKRMNRVVTSASVLK